jgi:alpha-tubulin suppressor-like RCC1 family protein
MRTFQLHYLLSLSLSSLVLLTCTGKSPFNPSEATVTPVLENSAGQTNSTTISDSVGRQVTITLTAYLPSYIDSVKVIVFGVTDTDSVHVFDKSTNWTDAQTFDIIFRSAGSRTVSIVVFAGGAEKAVTATINIASKSVPNRPPVLEVSGVRNIVSAQACSLSLSATDPDSGQTLTYAMIKGPQNATLTGTVFRWTSPATFTGIDSAIFMVTDNGTPAMSDTQKVMITVSSQIIAPAQVQGVKAVSKVNGYFVLSWNKVSNADSYNIFRAPDTVNFQKIGSTSDSLFGDSAKTGNFYYYVVAVNTAGPSPASAIVYSGSIKTPPVIMVPTLDTSVSQGKTLSFVVRTIASAQDTVLLGAMDISGAILPDSATFTPKTGLFTWTPTFGELGLYKIVFTATDGNIIVKDTVKITVIKTDRPPVVQTQSVNAGRNQAITITLVAADPDNDSIKQWRISKAAHNGMATLADSTKGSVVYAPNSSFIGVDTFAVDASDGTLWSLASGLVIVTVDSSKVAPKIQTQPTADTTVTQAGNFSVTVQINNAFPTPTFYWYQGIKGSGTLKGTTTNPTFFKVGVSAGDSGNYFVIVSNSSGADTSGYEHLAVNVASTDPTGASANPATICSGGSSSLSVSGGSLGTGASWKWYTDAACTTPVLGVNTGTPITVSPTSTTTYYVRAEGAGNNTATAGVMVTVNTASTAPTGASANPASICSGGTSTLSIAGGSLGTGASWKWYTNSGCTTPAAVDPTSGNVTPTSTTTYYVRAEGTCGSSTAASVTVTVNTASTAPTGASANPASICLGGSSTLSIAGGSLGTGASWKWYTNAGCTTPAAVDPTSGNVTPASTTTYYVRAEGTCGNTTAASVTVTLNSASVAATGATAGSTKINAGSSTTLSVSGGQLGINASWKWYNNSGCTGTAIGTGATITVTPASTTTYYVRAEGTCGNTTTASVTVAVVRVIQISGSAGHTLFVKSDSTLWACGDDYYGELCDDGSTDQHTPIKVANNVISAAAGGNGTYGGFSLYLTSNGNLYGCGANDHGQLGTGSTGTQPGVTLIATGVRTIAAGVSHTLFIKTDGTVWGCGSNSYGELGNSSTKDTAKPVEIAQNGQSVAAGQDFSLLLSTTGTLYAFGSNQDGQLGNGTTSYNADSVMTPISISNVESIAASYQQSFAIKSDGTVWAWGFDYAGQLGTGGNAGAANPTPVQMFNVSNAAAVSSGDTHTLIVTNAQALWATGDDGEGELCDGTITMERSPINPISSGVQLAVANKESASFVVKIDGTVWACGYNNSGQLGNGNNTSQPSLVKISGASTGF